MSDLYDDYDPDLDPELHEYDSCDCSDAELDWEGYFECNECGRRWDATVEQIEAYWKSIDDYNRPPTLWDRFQEWRYWLWQNMKRPFRSRKQMEMDSEIPF